VTFRSRVVATLLVEAAALVFLLVVALDVAAHKRVEQLGGLNIRGYRGAVALQKKPEEVRIAFIGGSRAFDWGAWAGGTTAAVVRQQLLVGLDHPGNGNLTVVALDLAQPGVSADTYESAIHRYAYLRPDYLCIYDDLGEKGAPGPLNRSALFAATGYLPALPLVLREKGMAWQFGDVGSGYAASSTGEAAPRSASHRLAGVVLQTVGTAAAALDRLPERAWPGDSQPSAYADAIMAAVDEAHRVARGVVVVVSPAETPRQAANLDALTKRMRGRLASDRWLRFVDLGEALELRDAALRVDGWNYGGAARLTAASRISPAVLDLMARP